VKSAEEIMNILEAYDLTGSLRDAAELAGCSHHTVARYVAEREQGRAVPAVARRPQPVIGGFLPKLEELVERSKGKIRADVAHEMTAAVPAPPPLDDGLDQLLRRMRMPHMRRIAPEVLAVAKAQRWDPAELLRALLTEEVAGRDRSSLATRRARAAFPTGKTFDAWDQHLSSVPAPTQQALRTLEWITRHENLVICGRARAT
jgi:hypothetical protein